MRAAWLDRRVRREAKVLVKKAHQALGIKSGLRTKEHDLATVTSGVEKHLVAHDLAAVRRDLPVLDALIEHLIKQPPKSTARDYVESIGAAVLIALALRAFVVEAFKIPSSSMYPTLEVGDHIFVNKFIYGVRIPWTTTKFFQFNGPQRGDVMVFIYPCDPERDYIKRVIATEGQSVEVRCSVVYVDGVAIPSKLVNPAAKYEDYSEESDKWTDTDVSIYAETVGDKTYPTYHQPERPQREKLLAEGTLRTGASRDFPHGRIPTCDDAPDRQKDIGRGVEGTLVRTRSDDEAKVCEQREKYIVPPGHIFAMGDNRDNSNDGRVWGAVPVQNVKGKALFIWLSYRNIEIRRANFELRLDRIGNFVR
ncbi:MAG: signal peptidase I [Kofleriaceae bacterium]